MQNVPWEDVCRVSRDYATTALKHLGAPSLHKTPGQPFRFVYVSGLATVRTKEEAEKSQLLAANPSLKPYMLMRVSYAPLPLKTDSNYRAACRV